MTYEESVEQLESLIEAWKLDEADLNQTDINAMQVLLKENEELKNIINQIGFKPDEIAFLQQENAELKKQLTTYQILHRDCKVDNLKNISKIEEMENQQKEFIKYLEDEKDELARGRCDVCKDKFDEADDILQKYKEIIGMEQMAYKVSE